MLKKGPLSYGQIQGFLFKLSDDGTYPREKLSKKNKHPYGYWGTNIAKFINNGLIEKMDDNLYHLTELGLINANSPFAKWKNLNQNQKTRDIKKTQDLEFHKNSHRDLLHENCNLRNELWELKSNSYEEKLKKEVNELEEQNAILNLKLSKYQDTEEIEYINKCINSYGSYDELEVDSYGVEILERIKNKLKGGK